MTLDFDKQGGLIPAIKTFQKEFPQVNLAISLHAPNDGVRKDLMPIAKKYSIDELLEAAKAYTEETSRRITFEYALSEGVNDREKDAEEKMNKPLILDGGMGTMLQNAGMGLGERPDIFGMNNPEILKEIQKKYIDAGSDIIYSNTFGANAHKLRGTGAEVRETVMKNIAVAKEAAGGKARVALDIGPIGELMEPLGTLSFEEAYEIFKEMVEC